MIVESTGIGGGTETYNPNYGAVNGITFYLRVVDSSGVDHTADLTDVQNNGGVISLSQGSNSVVYWSPDPNAFSIAGGVLQFRAGTGAGNDTAFISSFAGSFTYGSPITVTILSMTSGWHLESCSTGADIYVPASDFGSTSVSAGNVFDLTISNYAPPSGYNTCYTVIGTYQQPAMLPAGNNISSINGGPFSTCNECATV